MRQSPSLEVSLEINFDFSIRWAAGVGSVESGLSGSRLRPASRAACLRCLQNTEATSVGFWVLKINSKGETTE